ncbi:hypothetical protein [Rhodococcus sp. 05-2255-1e]|uniref:hypothetical protein n=1 Tax=Rhodococcus sp. 05-2255-1e TaxID=2022495 RepID=UPI00117B16DA|nr:hypothetical protein [Rhodococcus sp. 05-2255-1e]
MNALQRAVSDAVGTVWQRDDEVESFVTHLMSMSSLGASHDFKPDELARTVVKRVEDSVGGDARLRLIDRLAALLSAPKFFGFSKALDVSSEFDQVLHVARLVTDIRPVFDPDPSIDPIGAVVVHNLRLDYFHEGRIKTASFALNDHDLAQLKLVVERAQAKHATLTRLLSSSNLTEFDVAGEGDE